MILKKPYAFLIKYFKLIHLILMLLIIFFSTKFSKILSFFNGYVKGSTSISENASSIYISSILYIVLFIILAFSILMYLLMTKKQKPNKLYLYLFIYYIILFFSIIYAGNLINSLADATLSQQESRAYRDIYLILSMPNYLFIILSFIRGIGFDVKKFNFGKDLSELEISSEDSEEFEIALENDNYKAKRRIRRTIRELKYYILENRFIFTVICGLLLLVSIVLIGLKIFVTDASSSIGQTINANGFSYTLNKAYETKLNYRGNKIKKEKKYIILDMNITNNLTVRNVKSEYMYLSYDNQKAYFKTSNKNNFSDLGVVYSDDDITQGKTINKLLVFEIPDNVEEDKYTLYIYDQTKYNKDGEEYIYKKYTFTPERPDGKLDEEEKKLNEEIKLGEKLFGNSFITIEAANISGAYEYKYNDCPYNGSCIEKIDVELPSDPVNKKLLIIRYKLVKDPKSLFLKNNDINSLFNKYMNISYKNNDKVTEISADARINSKIDNIIILEVPQSVENYKDVNLVYKTRYNKYLINLK